MLPVFVNCYGLIIQNKMDYADVAELLESEASELERQAQELGLI